MISGRTDARLPLACCSAARASATSLCTVLYLPPVVYACFADQRIELTINEFFKGLMSPWLAFLCELMFAFMLSTCTLDSSAWCCCCNVAHC